jgi:hypothetical protein
MSDRLVLATLLASTLIVAGPTQAALLMAVRRGDDLYFLPQRLTREGGGSS